MSLTTKENARLAKHPLRDRGAMIRRQLQLLAMIADRPHTKAQIAHELGITTRQVYRDLEALQAVPLPIVVNYDEGQLGWWSCLPCGLTKKLFPMTAVVKVTADDLAVVAHR